MQLALLKQVDAKEVGKPFALVDIAVSMANNFELVK
jgi:hypothetical protein